MHQDGKITFEYVESRTGKTLHQQFPERDGPWVKSGRERRVFECSSGRLGWSRVRTSRWGMPPGAWGAQMPGLKAHLRIGFSGERLRFCVG